MTPPALPYVVLADDLSLRVHLGPLPTKGDPGHGLLNENLYRLVLDRTDLAEQVHDAAHGAARASGFETHTHTPPPPPPVEALRGVLGAWDAVIVMGSPPGRTLVDLPSWLVLGKAIGQARRSLAVQD
jgi:hypothetical protein